MFPLAPGLISLSYFFSFELLSQGSESKQKEEFTHTRGDRFVLNQDFLNLGSFFLLKIRDLNTPPSGIAVDK